MAASDDDDATRDARPTEAIAEGYRLAPGVVAASRQARYERGEDIARGGVGRVVAASDRKLQRRVAIKEMPGATAASFQREALTTARLQHPGIIAVFDSDVSAGGEPYLVLPFLEGATLADAIAARGTLEARLGLLPHLLAVADALGYAHAEGVVHRDIKPANIMIGAHGETVVLDWGVAYDLRAPGAADAFVGTPRFTSVEQARGDTPSPAFDVYSIGATIATALTGSQPFAGVTAEQILPRLQAGETALPALPAGVAGDLASIVAKATAPLATRYRDAGELAEDLRRFIAGQLVSARRYTTRELVLRWVLRHRLLVAAAAVVLALTIVTVVTIVAERDRAVAREHELVWLQAASHLRGDPTAALAWLKEYPDDGPLLAVVDEAEGRGVAQHVWHPAAAPADAAFAGDGALIVATSDGALTRIDPATGTRTELAKLPRPAMFVRTRGAEVIALDEAGTVWRAAAGGLVRVGDVELMARPTGVYLGPGAAIAVTLADDDAHWLGRAAPDLGRFVQADDERDGGIAFGVTAAGELAVTGPTPRTVAHVASKTWVRGSADGSHYLAVEPRDADSVAIWVGSASGEPPVEVARTRPCGPGENGSLLAEVADSGAIGVVFRCGVLAVYDVAAHRTIAVPEADRVTHFFLSRDARWLLACHSDGCDLVELATGVTRRLGSGATATAAGFSPDGTRLFTGGPEQGVRIWPLRATSTRTARLADAIEPVWLAVTGDATLSLRRHLGCALWDEHTQRIIATTPPLPPTARQPDSDEALWPWDASDDGATCLFAGRDGTVQIVDVHGGCHVVPAGFETCTLASDGTTMICAKGAALVTLDVASGRELATRPVAGKVAGLGRYAGEPFALVAAGDACTLETARGGILARLPGDRGCLLGGTTNTSQPGRETAIVVVRDGRLAVWNEHGVTEVTSELGRVEVSGDHRLAAALRVQTVELWDLTTHTPIAGPPPHARAIELAVWSSHGVLASSDDEVIQLWDAATGRTRTLVAPHVMALAWSRDGSRLYTTDGHVIQTWPIELARGATPAEVRARLAALTTARIRDGREETP